MTQINIQDAGLELSPLPNRHIGIADGKFTVPDDFDLWDEEIEEAFEEMLEEPL